jgi:hypothetical protein
MMSFRVWRRPVSYLFQETGKRLIVECNGNQEKELKIACALTLDDHFRQMGFEIKPN